MGYRKPMDYNSVNHQIYMTGVEIRSKYTDGFNQWALKQDLYRLKWLLDDILQETPTFEGEEEFLHKHEQELILQVLER